MANLTTLKMPSKFSKIPVDTHTRYRNTRTRIYFILQHLMFSVMQKFITNLLIQFQLIHKQKTAFTFR